MHFWINNYSIQFADKLFNVHKREAYRMCKGCERADLRALTLGIRGKSLQNFLINSTTPTLARLLTTCPEARLPDIHSSWRLDLDQSTKWTRKRLNSVYEVSRPNGPCRKGLCLAVYELAWKRRYWAVAATRCQSVSLMCLSVRLWEASMKRCPRNGPPPLVPGTGHKHSNVGMGPEATAFCGRDVWETAGSLTVDQSPALAVESCSWRWNCCDVTPKLTW